MIDQFDSQQPSTSQPPLTEERIKASLLESFKILSKTSPSNGELEHSHQIIAAMMKEEGFFHCCVSLIEEFQQSTAYANMAKLIITTLSTFLKHQQSPSRLVKKIDRHTLNKALIEVFFRQAIQEDLRILLVKSYTQFIYAPGMETIRGQTADLLCNNFGLMAVRMRHDLQTKKQLSDELTADIMSYIMVARAIGKGPIDNHQQKAIVKAFLPAVELLCKHFLSQLSGVIQQQNQQQFVHLSGLCDKLIEYFKELVIGTSKDSLYLLKHSIMKDPLVGEIITHSLSLSFKQPQDNTTTIFELVIVANGNKFIDRINEIKKNCTAVVNHFAKLCVTAQADHNNKQIEKEEYRLPLQICKHFIANVPEVLIREFSLLKYPQQDLPHAALYRTIITTLANIIRLHQFFSFSFQLRNPLFYGLCLPLLQRKETDQYVSAEEFKGRRQDILNMHSQDIPENAVCKLIESYVDRVDGSITFFSTTLKSMIEFHLSANPNSFAQLPSDLTESQFFQQTDFQIQIECGLMVFALFSYLSIGREELVEIVQALLVNRRDFFFNPQRTGMFKSAVLLTYSYYVDNFYTRLTEGKSPNKAFHIQVLQHCCTFIEQFTKSEKIEEERRGEHLALEIGAIQSLDCISNCISQKNFLPALFFTEEGFNSKITEASFYYLFSFLVNLFGTSLNVQAIDVLTEFFTEAIRSQCTRGHAYKRFHYEYKGVPMAIRLDVCELISESIYELYGAVIPHSELMKSKITTLLQTLLSCCQFPDQFMSQQFFGLRVEDKDVWQVAEPIDIFLRRMVIFRQENRAINDSILQQILLSAANLMQISRHDYQMRSLFGILINLIVLKEELIDDLAIFTTRALIQLLKEEDESSNYDEDLESIIQKVAYINLIAIFTRFTPRSQAVWCTLTECIQTFLANRSSKGIVAAKSIPYVGKLLAISLVCLCQVKRTSHLAENEQSRHLWANILRTADVYSTTAEKQIVASVFIGLLEAKSKIEENDEQCKRCFSLISHVLYKAYSKLRNIQEDYGDEAERESSSVDSGSDEDEEGEEGNHLHYKDYTIANNEYGRRERKDKYITAFKILCHKLREESPEFLKNVVEGLPLPIMNFVKSRVFYYQSLGSTESTSIRRVIKVKKEIPINE